MTALPDPRAAAEYRIPAAELVAGDLVNTQPGAGDDWQRVISVYPDTAAGALATGDIATLVNSLGGRYVVVELTDLAPVDSAVYFDNGVALTVGDSEIHDLPVAEVASDSEGSRIYLYTKYELVSIRANS